MKALLVTSALHLSLVGCSLDLPQVSPHHPANAEAPAGQTYAMPAFLELRPLSRPSDYPTSGPGYTMPPRIGPMKQMQMMQHEGMQHERGQSSETSDDERMDHEHKNTQTQPQDGESMKKMREKGQLHE